MPGDSSRAWKRERALFKEECKRRWADCAICKGRKGAIAYNAEVPTDPMAFTVEHVRPTSLGGEVMRKSNWRPAHFRLQQLAGQRGTERVPYLA
jgi:hypothetical protein